MEKKFIYSSQELLELMKYKKLTDDLFQGKDGYKDIDILLRPSKREKTVFLPYSGEFGQAVARYMVWFHFTNATHKIACVPRGYECFFPDAKEFVYDYPELILPWDKYKKEEWAYPSNKSNPFIVNEYTSRENMETYRHFFWEHNCAKSLRKEMEKFFKSRYNSVEIRYLKPRGPKDPLGKLIRLYGKIPFKNPNKYGIKVDVVFSNRKMEGDKRNFQKWESVVKYLQSKGLSVGGIGTPSGSYRNLNTVNNFDYENPNEASIEMLHNAKYYIGTDTGVTHLAMNFVHLKSLLFRMKDHTGGWIAGYENENTQIVKEMCVDETTFNDETLLFPHIDKLFK